MSVTVHFSCGGCDATAVGTDRLRREFRSFSGRSWGVGTVVDANSVEDITPPGWVAFDPYTHACYCPKCWAEIEAHKAPCLGCGKELSFAPDSPEARGEFNAFCPGGECEDRYAARL